MRIGAIETADDCLKATVKLCRKAIAGEINPVVATKLTFILNSVAQQIKNRDDTVELRALRAQLESIGALRPGEQLALPPAVDAEDSPDGR